jgi:hypothetical protein
VTSLAGEEPPRERTFHHLAEMAVEHTIEADGTHTFAALTSPEALLQRLTSLAHVNTQPRPEGRRAKCPALTLSEAWVSATNDGALGAARRLGNGGIERETARALGLALDGAKRITRLAAFEYPPGSGSPLPLGSLTLVEGPAGFWAFSQSESGTHELDVRPLSGAEVAGVLAQATASLRWTNHDPGDEPEVPGRQAG